MRLSHKDYTALDQVIFELYDYRDLKRFRAEVPDIFLKLVPSDYFFWPEFALPAAPDGVSTLVDFVESAPCVTPEKAGEIGENIMSHPFTCYFMNGGQPMALKLSDFLTQTQLQRSNVGEIYQHWGGFRYNLSLSVATGRGRAAAVGFCNSNRDFTERDRFVLGLLQRHFNRAHRSARLASSPLQFPEISFKDFALTPREAEIAIWLAQGKTNQEIAMILQGCVRTIEKHVEQILKKLHAENRATAAVLISSAVNSRT
jgi:DNA-binding CsgD family transcriptional regulator